MTIIDSLNIMRERLPVEKGVYSYIQTIRNEFEYYLNILNGIDNDEFEQLFENIKQFGGNILTK